MKIATWNINSVRLRIGLVSRFLKEHQPDVLCLQETKVMDELFPAAPLKALGYVHQAIHGQKAYHGVATLSRIPFRKTGTQDFCREGHARHMGVTFENGVELHNFYVPAGGDIPDPKANPKFAHKLHFLGEMAKFFGARKTGRSDPVVLVGDLNVAPLEHDVWSHKQLLNVVSHTPVETRLLGEGDGGVRLDRFHPALHSAGGENLFLVELSRGGLGGIGPGPAAGPCLGQSGSQRCAGLAKDHQENARLAESLRPCAGDRGSRSLMLAAFLRHGPTEWNAQGRFQGHTDIPLSVDGLAKMRALALPDEFAGARAYASPLLRARQTAQGAGPGGAHSGCAADGTELGPVGRHEPA